MKKFILLIILSYGSWMGNSSRAFAQESDSGYNPNSINPIHESDIMLQKRIWLRMDLKEKQNKPFFSFRREITKFIIEGVDQGLLTPYENDSLQVEMTKEVFRENLKRPEEEGGLSEEEKALGFTEVDDTDWGDSDQNSLPQEQTVSYFQPQEISVLEIMEDWIFDRRRSKLVYDIQSIKLIIPEEKFETGLFKVVGTFKYKDLATYFDSMPKEAIWVNPYNSAENRKLTEAFTLRLFSARIVKVENPDDDPLEQIYNKSPEEGIMASQWMEEKLIAEESNLWEE
ncbi:MAG: gliding motility protein GldN [Cytophagales bacterium]|nr:gliding motility protein GldN [Cytophagales bacterium]